MRTAEGNQYFSEVYLSAAAAEQSKDATSSLAAGHSLLLLHHLASESECESLRSEASNNASQDRADNQGSFYRIFKAFVHLVALPVFSFLFLSFFFLASRLMPLFLLSYSSSVMSNFDTPIVATLSLEILSFQVPLLTFYPKK